MDRLLLVGLMGSGKTTVGKLVARRLGWGFVDLDEEVEATLGKSVEDIFRIHGEATFREHEELAGRSALERSRVVIATGGGWAGVPGRLEAVDADTLSVWLQVSPEEAAGRIGSGAPGRPLARDSAPSRPLTTLLKAREPYYRLASVAVSTDGLSPDDVAATLERIVETYIRPHPVGADDSLQGISE